MKYLVTPQILEQLSSIGSNSSFLGNQSFGQTKPSHLVFRDGLPCTGVLICTPTPRCGSFIATQDSSTSACTSRGKSSGRQIHQGDLVEQETPWQRKTRNGKSWCLVSTHCLDSVLGFTKGFSAKTRCLYSTAGAAYVQSRGRPPRPVVQNGCRFAPWEGSTHITHDWLFYDFSTLWRK